MGGDATSRLVSENERLRRELGVVSASNRNKLDALNKVCSIARGFLLSENTAVSAGGLEIILNVLQRKVVHPRDLENVIQVLQERVALRVSSPPSPELASTESDCVSMLASSLENALVSTHSTASYRLRHFVSEYTPLLSSPDTFFYDAGRFGPLSGLEDAAKFGKRSGREIVLVSPSRDKDLAGLMDKAHAFAEAHPDPRDRLKKITDIVVNRMGGVYPSAEPEASRFRDSCTLHINDLRAVSPIILLGCVKLGSCRHRAILFKVLADTMRIPCRLMRGYRGAEPHSWVVVNVPRPAGGSVSVRIETWDGTFGKDGEGDYRKEISVGGIPMRSMARDEDRGAPRVWSLGEFELGETLYKQATTLVNRVVGVPRVAEGALPRNIVMKQIPAASKDHVPSEIGVLQRLRHPHVVSAVGLARGVDRSGQPVWGILMKYATTSLYHLLNRSKITLQTAVSIGLDIATGMAYVHGHNPAACLGVTDSDPCPGGAVVHMDLKPENILFVGKVACIGDFGAARYTPTPGGSVEPVAGTPDYMSPEHMAHLEYRKRLQAGRRPSEAPPPLTRATDVYSFGILLAEMLGVTPREAGSGDLSGIKHELMRDLVTRCLKANPPERPTFASLTYRLSQFVLKFVSHDTNLLTARREPERSREHIASPDSVSMRSIASGGGGGGSGIFH